MTDNVLEPRDGPPLPPNGEVEGPDDHVGQAPRAYNLFQRQRRSTTGASRPPRTIVRRHVTIRGRGKCSPSDAYSTGFPTGGPRYWGPHPFQVRVDCPTRHEMFGRDTFRSPLCHTRRSLGGFVPRCCRDAPIPSGNLIDTR